MSLEISPVETDQIIPPCIKSPRLTDAANRATANSLTQTGSYSVIAFTPGSITWEGIGDGMAKVVCRGNSLGCSGGSVSIDRHDLLQDRMPETTAALGKLCTSTRMFYSVGNLIRPQVVDHSNEL